MVALMNKNLLPVRFNVPIYGEIVTLSRGLLFNIDLILFRKFPGVEVFTIFSLLYSLYHDPIA